jgi:hypothetical protein
MDNRSNKRPTARDTHDGAFDLDALLHPAGAFGHPSEVVNDPDLTLAEKRAILASWASDACAVEAAPALRRSPAAAKPVAFDDIMDALRTLDKQVEGRKTAPPHYRRVLARRFPGVFGRRSRDDDTGNHGRMLN